MSMNQPEVSIKKGNMDIKELLRCYSVGLTIVFLLIIAAVTTGGVFFEWSNLLNVGERASIVGIVAMGQMLVILTGGIDLSVSGTMALSFTTFAIWTDNNSMPIWLAFICALLIGILVGAVNGILVVKSSIPPFLITLSTVMILNSLALFVAQAKQLLYANLQDWINYFLGNSQLLSRLLPTVIWLIFSALLLFILGKTRTGMNIYAVGGQAEAAFLSGVRSTWTKINVYMMSGLFASIAAMIFAYRLGALNPTAAESYQLESIAAVILGGASVNGGEGTVYGSFFGAILIAMLMNIMNLLQVNPFIQYSIMGFILILIVILQKYLSKR